MAAPVIKWMRLLTSCNRTSDGQLIDNKLKNVDDPINAGYYTTDIDGQAANYYSYDRIGNIIQEGTGMNVDKIYWTVYGKIKQIERLSNSQTIELFHINTTRRETGS